MNHTSELDELFAAARGEQQAGNTDAAEQGYVAAAERARSDAQPLALAHALRHISHLARDRGLVDEAVAAASEAVAIYRTERDAPPLDLANALRLHALALTNGGLHAEALPLWKEARDLYASIGVVAGMREADRQLSRAN